MTETRPFYCVPVRRKSPEPDWLTELKEFQRIRLNLLETIERVYAELVLDQDPLAIPLGLALEDYKHPFSMVAHAQNLASETPSDSLSTG